MKLVFQAIGALILAFVSSTIATTQMLRSDIDRVVTDLENGIAYYDNKEKLCELHSEFGVQALYVISNPFRDFTNFTRTNEYCDKKEYL